ncbi:hypothetical protein HHI36_008566 [Cryptolaemus montrouzieri]|uniref:Endonuclease/exonuclease/phosphatase domain-containing protein n=1 Tax=Cryptolaemus montrouzieri TaxID=559131 RepID=A0ABD2MSW7_9CUCU
MQCECCAAMWRSASLTVPSVVVVAIYRRSGGAFNVFIHIVARILDALGVYGRHRIVIVGDYNVDFLVESSELSKLKDLMQSYGFRPTIDQPTKNEICMDSIFVCTRTVQCRSEVIQNGILDHSAQQVCLDIGDSDIQLGVPCSLDK